MTNVATSERRGFGRRDSSIPAKIVGPGRGTLACTIKNFSECGALIEIEGVETPKGNFRLLADDPRVDVLCQVRHVGPNGIGVMFVGGNAGALVESFKLSTTGLETVQLRAPKVATALSNRELRRSVLARG